MRGAFLSLLLLPLLLAAQPCACEPAPPAEAREAADIVFEGTCAYVNTNWISGGMKYAFTVERSWKRRIDRYYIVNTGFEKDCGVSFEQGKRYVVYVRKKFTPRTSRCMGTKKAEAAGPDLALLGEGIAPQPSALLLPMYWILGLLGLFSLAFLAFVVLRKRPLRRE